jgi:uncharacterized protein YcbK (DUF882 family)
MATNYSSNEFHRAGWLVYINGLEIPVETVSTSSGIWQPPTATLGLSPHALLRRIGAEDRLQVAIFYLDHHWGDFPTFRLLGEYEVVGYGYNNTPRGRQMQLQCMGQMAFFQQLNFFYISAVDDMVLALSVAGQTNTAVAYNARVLYPFSIFYDGLLTSTADDKPGEPIKRPIEFVLNVFKALLAASDQDKGAASTDPNITKVPPQALSVPGKNFFARWLELTQFHRRWAGFPGVDDLSETGGAFPLLKAAQGVQMLDSLKNQVGGAVGNSGTAWDLLQLVLGYMYMEPVSLLAPPAFEVDPTTALATGAAAHPVTGNTRITSHYVKPAMYFALPPTCNVFFPSQITSWEYSENYREVPTRLYMNELFLTKMLNEGGPDAGQAISSKDLMVTGYPPPVRERLRSVFDKSVDNSKNMLLFPEEFYAGPNAAQCSSPPWLFMLAQEIQGSPSAQVTPNDPMSAYHEIFDNFAQYEYYRRRYANRGGSVSMVWNPYVIPGFPGVVFDKGGDGLDVFMYISGVSHSMDARGNKSTNVSFAFTRTLEEFAGVAGSTTLQVMANNASGRNTSTEIKVWTREEVKAPATAPVQAPASTKLPILVGNGIKFKLPGEDPTAWSAADYAKFNALCADPKTGEVPEMDPNLIPVIVHMSKGFPGKEIQIFSAFRKRYNKAGELVTSEHHAGTAIDFRVAGANAEEMWVYAMDSFPTGMGIGYYPNSGEAIHLDVRHIARGNPKRKTTWWVHTDAAGEKYVKSLHTASEEEKAAYLAAARGLVAERTVTKLSASKTVKKSVTTEEVLDDAGESEGLGDPSEEAAAGQTFSILTPDIVYDMYPVEPIPEIAQAYQSLTNAQEMYARFLYGSNVTGRPAVFEWKKLLQAHDAEGNTIDLASGQASLTTNCTISPKAELEQMYDTYDTAMRYAARPVCSLQDYIAIWHKKNDAAAEAASLEQVRGTNTTFYGPSADQVGGATYPTRIYKLRQGPGADPGATVTNVGTAAEGYAPVAAFKYADKDMAQTRDNWDARLEQYRKIVLSAPGYKHPQG